MSDDANSRLKIEMDLDGGLAAELARCVRASVDRVATTEERASALHDIADAIEGALASGKKTVRIR